MDSKEAIKRLLDIRNNMDKCYREELERGGKKDFDVEDDIAALEIGIDAISIKHGQWIHQTGYDKRDNWYVCSECGRSINLIGGDRLENYPYCHCGAKMSWVVADEIN